MKSVVARRTLPLMLGVVLAAAVQPGLAAEAGNWIVRGRAIHVTPERSQQ